MPDSKHETADLIERLKTYYVAMSSSLVFLNDPDVLRLVEAKGYDVGSRVTLGRRDGTQYEGLPDFWTAINAVRGRAGFNLDYLGAVVTVIVSWVGDSLAQHDYFDGSPELLFFRHLRNAVSHGNRWHFLGGEPREQASFGPFTLEAGLHGRAVLFEYLSAGDVFDLLDHAAGHLRSLT